MRLLRLRRCLNELDDANSLASIGEDETVIRIFDMQIRTHHMKMLLSESVLKTVYEII